MSDPFETSAPEPEPAPEKPVLRTAEVASLFGRTDRCIRNWVTAGHLHPVRIGRSVFFRRAEIEGLLGP